MKCRDAIPSSWVDHLTDAPVGLGLDLATSAKGTSNPSVLAATQKEGRIYRVRLIVSFKTENPDVTREVVKLVCEDILRKSINIRKLSVDASNEVFFARQLKTFIQNLCSATLVKGGEKIKHNGIEMDAKTLLGHLYVNAIEDGQVELPLGDFIFDDHRLVKNDRGGFITDLGKNGQHGDTFDAVKLSIWSLVKGGGKVQAQAITQKSLRTGLIGSLSDRFRKLKKTLST
jgi:hypothetical protein